MEETLKHETEKEEVRELSAPTSEVVFAAVAKDGQEALTRPTSDLFYSALAAGMSMTFSMIAEAMLASVLPDEAWRPAVSKFGYCVGFLIVILGRQQLYTESTLSPMLPVLRRSPEAHISSLLRVWFVALGANLIGAAVVAFIVAKMPVLSTEATASMLEMGRKAMEPEFGTTLLRGVFAGWLIALMVWLLPFAESSRVLVIVIITYVVGLGNFSHVIAGSAEVFTLAASGETGWAKALFDFTLPAFIGNTLGGVVLVAMLAHAQAKPDK